MSDCEKYSELISRAIDGEISEADMNALSAHLASCVCCRRVFDAFTAISESLRESAAEPHESLARGVMTRINPPASRKRPRGRVLRFAALAACFAIIIYAGARIIPLTKKGAEDSGQIASMTAPEAQANDSWGENPPMPATEPETKIVAGGEPVATSLPETATGEESVQMSAVPEATFEVFLFSESTANLYSNAAEDVSDPLLASIDGETLDALFSLLGLTRTDSFDASALEPVYTLQITGGESGSDTICFWIVDGLIYSNDRDGNYYTAACGFDDFINFFEGSYS